MSAVFDIEISELEREADDAVGIITAEQTDEVRKEAYAESVKGLYKLTALVIFTLGFTIVVVADETTGWGFVGLMDVSWVVIIGNDKLVLPR